MFVNFCYCYYYCYWGSLRHDLPQINATNALQDSEEQDMGQEMEDVFLRGIQPLLTTYLEKHLHPALRDTLMVNMGYSVSYGR